MAKTWVLDTETKGTGAHVVPIEKTLQPARIEQELALVELERAPRPPQPAPAHEPLRFKVVNVMNGHVLAEGTDARETVRVLEAMRSVLDARIFEWVSGKRRWRLLTLGECKALWAFRGRLESPATPAVS